MAYADEITGATSVWSELGYKGEGMVVSIIDSGIDYRHKDLKITNNDVKLTQSNMNAAIEQFDYGKYFTNKVHMDITMQMEIMTLLMLEVQENMVCM